MTRQPALDTGRIRTAPLSTLRTHRPRFALSAALLAATLLLGGCSDGSADAAVPTSPGAPDASEASDSRASLFGGGRREERAVAAVAAAWDAAWNAGDSKALAALFTDDAEFINGRGQIAKGVAAIYAQNSAQLAGGFKGSHIEGQIRNITFLSRTAAVLDVDSRLTGYVSLPPGTVPSEPGAQRGRHKRVVVKRGGVWKIAQMQITLIAPTP